MKRINLSVVLCGAMLAFSASAQANDFQKYYDTGAQLITKFRSCSTIPNQVSIEVSRCLDESSSLINKKTNELKQKHAATIKRDDSAVWDLLDSKNQVGNLKQACAEIYPDALRVHFKNQIRSCQIQLDLNRFFYIYDYVINFG